MRLYFDTSILLPALIQQHSAHEACLAILTKAKIDEAVVMTCTNHTYAELYANITRLPHGLAVPPEDAAKLITGYLAGFFTPIHLTNKDYAAAINRCAALKLMSGVIYDALHFQAAIKAEVDILYTANMRDFQRLLTEEVSFQLKST